VLIEEPFGRLIIEFWERVEETDGIADRLLLLQEFATRRAKRKRTAKQIRSLIRRRRDFIKKGTACWACEMRKAIHRHHVIQIQYGGSDGPECTVPLCRGCHAVVHPWLRKPRTEK
jgi:hypothetical protein